ncbi:MAG: aminoacyl-tRNA hydrolase [Lactobacillaceae bacterium]|jgi:PTH1 family peptidyl-tRNA hydrolase|nr:aminoacyl-tRNA hydrolase [Lactobacillaceae bacterium]
MFLIVGLGNPGAEYVNTRHNVGFMTADAVAEKYGFSAYKSKFDGLIAEGKIAGEKVMLLKPQTYMNLSGNSVVKAALFYKILPENIIVIHDDLDLEVGKIKTKLGGGAGGHNGIKSIDSHITPGYNRIRIGIGYPNEKRDEKVVAHVLGKISKAEEEAIGKSVEIVTDTISILIKEGVSSYSNKLGMLLYIS